MNSVNITRTAGWIAIVGGFAHLVVSAIARSQVWSDIAGGGVWNTVTLDPGAARLAAAEAFWLTPGSFAMPLLLFGAYVLWSARQGHRVPAAFGWAILVWGAIAVVLLPVSPGWLIPLVGGLLVAGDRSRVTA
ncbi:DUF6463 family protein [Actinokineospora iranica]|uniref:Uncharacterized protein n=1 Tax=Actinokineospora iranica TaxID=1271860 RepID=A0A1G6N086_9PSEU|nr:DUF6463 family protein [Actinokineospora iranica]SDC61222.1 hypothetical protein SAMN05216174_103124 [Actinokineospora iranica]